MPEPLINYTIQSLIEEDQVFATKDQLMEEDITILQVPTYEVSDPGGGIVLIIGDN